VKKLQWPNVALTVVALAMALSACGPLSASTTLASRDAAPLIGGASMIIGTSAQQGVVVSATGVANADPEIAQVTFGVELRGQDPDALVSEAAQKMTAAMAAATSFGIVEDKTRTLNYSLWVETVHDPNTGRPTGDIVYHLSHQVQVTTESIGSVGELLAGVVNAGANAVGGVNFSVEDPAALVSQARDAALAEARARAQHIAGQMDVSLGKLVLVAEVGGDTPVFADRGIGGGSAMMEMAAPSVTAGSFSVSVSVQVVYEIR
jgi:uncharacterized protein